MTTPHNHPVVFGRKVDGCARCTELKNGAAPIMWASTRRKQDDARTMAAIRAHDCNVSRCGPVCTVFEW